MLCNVWFNAGDEKEGSQYSTILFYSHGLPERVHTGLQNLGICMSRIILLDIEDPAGGRNDTSHVPQQIL
jgi:hypothetical protein